MSDKYIFVGDKKVCVSDEVYKAYKKQLNHEAYLKKLDRKYGVFNAGNFDEHINNIADSNVDIEKIIETKMRIEDLYRALESLNGEERNIIAALYFDDKTITEVAKQHDTNPMKISRLRNKILKKLKKFLDG